MAHYTPHLVLTLSGGRLTHLQNGLAVLAPVLQAGMVRGIEKESLRIRADGSLALTPHPRALGAALTHPHITTDFSESQVELITGVHPDAESCSREITEIHQFVYAQIAGDALWSSSMPCRLPRDDAIPIGQYGTSNVGKLKTVYRHGLARRYGSRMQTISGVHYNFSLPDAAWPLLTHDSSPPADPIQARTAKYFDLIRNFRRRSWLPLYLFGASPAVCRSFVAGRRHSLMDLSGDTLYLPYATSLRMGPLGYQSDAQASLAVSYNSLRNYAGSLNHALTVTYPPYEAIGVFDGDGEYRQLATTLLQIENEFYGTIRPKRRIRRGERPLHALTQRGVEYIEVRSLDVDPYSAVGISPETMQFLDVFLLHCLLADSPADTPGEIAAIAYNQYRVAERGREPGIQLQRDGRDVGVAEWGTELVDECEPVAAALDDAQGGHAHRYALRAARAALREPARTPSARVLQQMSADYDNSYVAFALDRSLLHRRQILAMPAGAPAQSRLKRLAEESVVNQKRIEDADDVTFETYRRQYLAQDLMSGLGAVSAGPAL